jgi:hypothetical protein
MSKLDELIEKSECNGVDGSIGEHNVYALCDSLISALKDTVKEHLHSTWRNEDDCIYLVYCIDRAYNALKGESQ